MKKTFTIHVSEIGGSWSAICPELCVSGFGGSKKEAIEAVIPLMSSALTAMASMLKRDTLFISRTSVLAR